MLRQLSTSMTFETRGRRLLELTRPITEWVDEAGLATGLLTVFVRHTSASLLIQENADPDVRGDLDRFFARLVPDGDPLFRRGQDRGLQRGGQHAAPRRDERRRAQPAGRGHLRRRRG
ncbi:MAG: YjbQ family protein [Rhizobiales bacterium]|nr:YjbQ family protein [Rhizobacter sp.]